MAYKVLLTPAAENDYQEIVAYMTGVLCSTQAVRTFVQKLTEVMEHLQKTPGMYELSRVPELRAKGYHKFLIGKYVALFQIDETNATVFIARIFHGSQNYQKYL